ncbi:MAG: SLBB domain-containing protein [Spirochaetaceae bacterium]|jgi:hypothetical protein|nr:SLBB domain-containing protein [Spirochaetaceae bacterium]
MTRKTSPAGTADMIRGARVRQETLTPNCTSTASTRLITLAGEVFRPGIYELGARESLTELISHYGRGFTLNAALTAIMLIRAGQETTRFSWEEDRGITLEDGDTVRVEPILPEGATYHGGMGDPAIKASGARPFLLSAVLLRLFRSGLKAALIRRYRHCSQN